MPGALMRILHIANGDAGQAAASVRALQQWSRHKHELVAKWSTGYVPVGLTESNTDPETVLELANQADVLHFHGMGFDGTHGNFCSIHDIDWAAYRGDKKFVFHGYESMLLPDGKFVLPGGDRFRVANLQSYDLLLGGQPSCALSYDAPAMKFVPSILPIHDWLLTPMDGWTPSQKPFALCTTRIRNRCAGLVAAGLPIEYIGADTTPPAELLRRRRDYYVAALDNYSDGHLTNFGYECLAQGVPVAAHISAVDADAYVALHAERPPIVEMEYGGVNAAENILGWLSSQTDADLDAHAELGREWIEKFYDPEKLVWLWDDAYKSLSH